MNIFAKNPTLIVSDVNGILPFSTGRYSNATGDPGNIADLNAQLAQKNIDLATTIAAKSKNDGDIRAIQAYINGTLIPQGNYAESHVQSDKIDTVLVPLGASLQVKIDGLKIDIENLKQAIVAANTLALHNANLSPADRAALEKQNAEILAAQNEATSRSKNLKILAFGGAALLLLLGIGFVILEVKKVKNTTV